MAYRNNIPQPTDKKSQSQADLLNNFAIIKTLVDVNHVTFDNADQGKHIKIDLTDLAADATTAVNELALYNNGSKLYLREQNDGEKFNLMPSTTGHTANGYEVLPSGLILNWGTISFIANQETKIAPFAKAFPTAPFNITHSVRYNSGGYDARDVGFPTITLATDKCTFTRDTRYNGASLTLWYLAIGH